MGNESDLLPRFLKNLSSLCNVVDGEKILIGCSGGPDSISMLHLFHRAKKILKIKIFACHINYGLRDEESNKDEELVKEYCKKWKIPLEIKKVLPIKDYSFANLEEKLREIRYNIFSEVAKKNECSKIAVAHNKNDQAETLLLNLIRGAGTDGLSGMSPKNEQGIIRPMLNFTRNEIMNYINNYKLNYREDSSNYSVDFTRNKIRNILIPILLKEFNPNLINILYSTSSIIKDEGCYIEGIAEKYIELYAVRKNNFISFPLEIFQLLDVAIKRRILRLLFKHITKSTRKLHFSHIEFILDELNKERRIEEWHLPNQARFKITDRDISFYLKDFYDKINKFEYKVKVPFKVHIRELNNNIEGYLISSENLKEYKTDKSIFYLDYERCGDELIIRNRRDGDVFRALGSPGRKKLKEYLINKKIPKDQRDRLILVESQGEIIAIMGVEINENYKITDKSKQILVLRVYERNDKASF